LLFRSAFFVCTFCLLSVLTGVLVRKPILAYVRERERERKSTSVCMYEEKSRVHVYVHREMIYMCVCNCASSATNPLQTLKKLPSQPFSNLT
jgi:hypothetical protein